MISIVQREDPVLRGMAKDVPVSEISKPKVQDIVKKMKQALAEQKDGVAIAAPQIGVPLRIFVVSRRLFAIKDGIDDPEEASHTEKYSDLVFINPEILKVSKKRKLMPEGCLSCRWLYGKVSRAEKARVRAYNEAGEQFEMGGAGLLAQVFQHETDHLNGILFIDTAVNVVDQPPEEVEGKKRK